MPYSVVLRPYTTRLGVSTTLHLNLYSTVRADTDNVRFLSKNNWRHPFSFNTNHCAKNKSIGNNFNVQAFCNWSLLPNFPSSLCFLFQAEAKINPWEKEEGVRWLVRMFEPQTKSVTLIRKTVIGRQNKQRWYFLQKSFFVGVKSTLWLELVMGKLTFLGLSFKPPHLTP